MISVVTAITRPYSSQMVRTIVVTVGCTRKLNISSALKLKLYTDKAGLFVSFMVCSVCIRLPKKAIFWKYFCFRFLDKHEDKPKYIFFTFALQNRTNRTIHPIDQMNTINTKLGELSNQLLKLQVKRWHCPDVLICLL